MPQSVCAIYWWGTVNELNKIHCIQMLFNKKYELNEANVCYIYGHDDVLVRDISDSTNHTHNYYYYSMLVA